MALEAKGLIRSRLISRLVDPSTYRFGWVVAPAGSGKSRLLAHLAQAYSGPVAWGGYPDPIPRTAQALAKWLWEFVAPAAGVDMTEQAGPPEPSLDRLTEALGGPGPAVLVLLDDVHLIEGSEAESALADLVARMPARLRMVAASRVSLGLDLSRMRVSGQLIEIGPDDLRFRTWEVEELFRDVYRDPLLPEDVAALARRTDGWAAYLQLFYLATARKPKAERRRVLESLLRRTRLVSEYLGRHVLAGLSAELQDFLVRSSVLRRPTAALCDELLGWSQGSAELLSELERRQLFTERIDDDSYRYHAVLLSYLDSKLVETVGIAAARQAHQHAGLLLEREGLAEDALAAFAKSEDWEGVARILGHTGTSAAGLGDAWIDALPPTVIETDAMLMLVRGRRALGRGALTEAVRILRDAEAVAVSAAVAERCRTERDHILPWAETGRPVSNDWVGVMRRATQRSPTEAHRQAAQLPGVTGRFAEGCSAFMAGDMRTAARLLSGVASHPDSAPPIAAGALLASLAAAGMSGRAVSQEDVERLREEVEVSGIPWLDRVTRAALATVWPNGNSPDDFAHACEREGDRWGAAVVTAIGGVGQLRQGSGAAQALERSARTFGEMGAGVVEATVLGLASLAALRSGDLDNATRLAEQVRTIAALLDVAGAAGLASLVLGVAADDERELARARQTLEPLGTWEWHTQLAGLAEAGAPLAAAPPAVAAPPAPEVADAAALSLRCLGAFSLTIDGKQVTESSAKPMERALLHLLAMKAGGNVHREALIEALWPEADPEAGLHRLQVAVSALRRLLSAAGPHGAELLVRNGDAYRLDFPAGSDVDVIRLDQAIQKAGNARSRGDLLEEEEALGMALASYSGPLLPGDGPADWVVGHRAALQAIAAEAAVRLATLRIQSDDPHGAAEAARAGLAVDRYRDELWKVLILAAERAGNHAEAGQARRAYEAVLEELGV